MYEFNKDDYQKLKFIRDYCFKRGLRKTIFLTKMSKIAYLTRTAKFSAAHRLHSIYLTDKQNADLYGKCNNINSHGHNYTVEVFMSNKVTVKGEISHETGMVMNLTDLKKILDNVLALLDHMNLDANVEFFKTRTSTAENLSVFIWQEVEKQIKSCQLYKVTVYETDYNKVEYYGYFSY